LLGRLGDKSDIPRLRARLDAAPDEVIRAYIEHSIANLGDPDALKILEKNLASKDGSIRTFAATFAGEIGAVSLAPQLTKQLDDEHHDARYRAAQALLFLGR